MVRGGILRGTESERGNLTRDKKQERKISERSQMRGGNLRATSGTTFSNIQLRKMGKMKANGSECQLISHGLDGPKGLFP